MLDVAWRRLDGRRVTGMGFGRTTAIVGLALLLAACQGTTPPGSPASSAVPVNASPAAGPSSTPAAGSDAVRSPTFTPGPRPSFTPTAGISHVVVVLSLIHISEPTRLGMISYAVFCLKQKKTQG